jgi:hypothetical protein
LAAIYYPLSFKVLTEAAKIDGDYRQNIFGAEDKNENDRFSKWPNNAFPGHLKIKTCLTKAKVVLSKVYNNC